MKARDVEIVTRSANRLEISDPDGVPMTIEPWLDEDGEIVRLRIRGGDFCGDVRPGDVTSLLDSWVDGLGGVA